MITWVHIYTVVFGSCVEQIQIVIDKEKELDYLLKILRSILDTKLTNSISQSPLHYSQKYHCSFSHMIVEWTLTGGSVIWSGQVHGCYQPGSGIGWNHSGLPPLPYLCIGGVQISTEGR